MSNFATSLRCPCEGRHFSMSFTYTMPPAGESRFRFSSGAEYRREVLQCQLCGHFISRHDMDTSILYSADYVDSTYGDDGIQRNFERIIGLDPATSDNVGRVESVITFAQTHFPIGYQPTILDVGSGLCVFLHRVKQVVGWRATALDPDPRAVAHAHKVVGVNAICADLMTAGDLDTYDIITFNKVLEHIEDPVGMLARSRTFLKDGGFVYLEVPDGEMAVHGGPEREEFFIEHFHIFSAASVCMLAARAGYRMQAMERLREPSTKYTLRAFLT